eukprot:gene13984-4948_t
MHKALAVKLTVLIINIGINEGKEHHNPFIWKGKSEDLDQRFDNTTLLAHNGAVLEKEKKQAILRKTYHGQTNVAKNTTPAPITFHAGTNDMICSIGDYLPSAPAHVTTNFVTVYIEITRCHQRT